MDNTLELIKQQLESYHLALDLRQNAGAAAQNFATNVAKILEMPYQQGEHIKTAGKIGVQKNADTGGADKKETENLPEGDRGVPVQSGADGTRTDNRR